MKDNSLLILQYIIARLKSCTSLAELIDVKKIWATIAPENTPVPYIILTRDNLEVTYTKDISHDNLATFTVSVYGKTYDEAIYIANEIRNVLENAHLHNDEICIHPIQLASCSEGITETYNYVQQLVFSCYIE